jgi:hypothetical protein
VLRFRVRVDALANATLDEVSTGFYLTGARRVPPCVVGSISLLLDCVKVGPGYPASQVSGAAGVCVNSPASRVLENRDAHLVPGSVP